MDHDAYVEILIRNVGRDPSNAVEDRRFLIDMINRLNDTINSLVDQEQQ